VHRRCEPVTLGGDDDPLDHALCGLPGRRVARVWCEPGRV